MATQKLAGDEIERRLKDLPGWKLREGAIYREFKFADFVQAFGFMTSCALVCEAQNHHPDWRNVWNRVEVAMSTHDAGGITEKDFAVATAMNQVAARFG